MEHQIRLFPSDEIDCITGVDGCVGKGSYGIVRLGFHWIHGVVALKCSVMNGEDGRKNELKQRIKNEIDLMQQAHHENIVRVYGWTQWAGAVAMVMEYLPGGNLMEALEDDDVTLEYLLRLRMCYEIANGIAFIHNFSSKRRLIHGDIKAENILLTEDLHCKLTDFGGARLSPCTEQQTSSHNYKNAIQFTEFYASPEILEHASAVLKPSQDTYSFSVTMYVVIGRELPIISNPQMYLEKVKRGHRPDIDVINEVIHQLKKDGRTNDAVLITTLKEIMEECWSQNPSDRPLMVDVKNRLYYLLARHDPVKIQQHAVDAAREMDIKKLSRDQHECLPLCQILPPHFNSTKTPLSTKSNDILSTTTQLENCLSDPEITCANETNKQNMSVSTIPSSTARSSKESRASLQLINQQIENIKEILENEEMKEAVTQSRRLASMTTNDIVGDCDVIVGNIIEVASAFAKNKRYLASLSIIGWVMQMFDKIKTCKVKLKKLNDCREVICDIAVSMNVAGMKTDIQQKCLPLAQQLLEQMKMVQTDNVQYKAEVEALCRNGIGLWHYYVDDDEQADETFRKAIRQMKTELGEESAKYQVLAYCYCNCGLVNYEMGKYEEAVKLYKESIKIFKSLGNIREKEKKEYIADVEKRLYKARFKIKELSSSSRNKLIKMGKIWKKKV